MGPIFWYKLVLWSPESFFFWKRMIASFSTSNTTDADYSVNQQSSDCGMNGYTTGTDTETSQQFHLNQSRNGLTDIPNVPYNHDDVPSDYKQNPG